MRFSHIQFLEDGLLTCKINGKMADVNFMQMKPVNVQTMLYELVDTLWLFSSLIHQSPHNWQGFMAKIVKGVWDCTAIRFHT